MQADKENEDCKEYDDMWPGTLIRLSIQVTAKEIGIAFKTDKKVGSIVHKFLRCECESSKEAVRYYLLLLLLENDPTSYWVHRPRLISLAMDVL